MVVQETIQVGSNTLRKTYSDNNKMIIQVETNIEYSEAIDPIESVYTYVESENELSEEMTTDEEKLIALGVTPTSYE